MMRIYYCRVGSWARWEQEAALDEHLAAMYHAVKRWEEWPTHSLPERLQVMVCDRVRLSGPTPTRVFDVVLSATEVTP